MTNLLQISNLKDPKFNLTKIKIKFPFQFRTFFFVVHNQCFGDTSQHDQNFSVKQKQRQRIKRCGCISYTTGGQLIIFSPNTSLGPLSFTFVSYRSFKLLRFQIDLLSFEFVSDRSFKFLRFQRDPLNFEFVSDRSLTEVDRKDQSETNSKLKGPI